VEVLEHEHERPSRRDPRQRPRDQLVDVGAVVDLRPVGARGPFGAGTESADLTERRKDRDQFVREIGEVGLLRRRMRLASAEILLQQLDERLVRKGAVLLQKTSVQNPDPARPGERLDLFEQTALADPRLASDDDELALSLERRVEPPLDVDELLLASDEA